MQLASQSGEKDQPISPTISAALIDSLFETPGPLLAGIIFAAIAAAMTALKTDSNLIWGCVALIIVTGSFRAFDLQRYQSRQSALATDEAAKW